MKVEVYLLDTETGQRRIYHDDYDYDDEAQVRTIYSEGNYGCDCNRAIFWRAAGGKRRALTDGDAACGETRYTIEKIARAGGNAIAYDAEDEAMR